MTAEAILPETQTKRIAKEIADRAERGRDLYLTKRQLIMHVAPDVYQVPGNNGTSYEVHYGAREDCSCTDYQVHGGQLACKHLVAVALMFTARRRRALL